MRESWATSLDLLLDLPAGGPRRAGLEDALRAAVSGGRLAEGSRLPSSRSLAVQLGLSRNTVADAYAQLVAEGWLVARHGSATRVAAHGRAPSVTPAGPASAKPAYDLTSGVPDVSAFPRAAWLRAVRQALGDAPHDTLDYPDPLGSLTLREELSAYLGRVRGVRAGPDHIVVCTGTSQAFFLLAKALGGGPVAVESHGLRYHRRVLEEGGGRLVPMAVDEDGADVSVLGSERGVVLTAAHQFPFGVALSPARRAHALAWARRTGGLVIEDDYDGEFRYDRRPVGALQGLDPEQVAYVGTVSKTLAPGLRLGWIAAPPGLLRGVVRAKLLSGGGAGVFDQLTLAAFIRSGGYDRHIRRSRLRYRRRRDALVRALDGRASVTGVSAGLHALVPVDDEDAVVARGARRGLALHGLGTFGTPGGLVVGYARPPDHAYAGALRALRALL
ncbi:PLP-dependent aminotransferase family protein [Actinoplanes sp. NPDC051411]|uniref:MocR-like pyridoxine biosynthesis transcription factor PdxR n=1 Tax=Actinoplanes sp. NPDC051411 TaxID=3155522 RepID=UPI003422EAAA